MEEIINSIMQTPDNTNPNVLRSQLQGMASSSNGGVLVMHDEDGTLDKTWKEIHDAPFAVLRVEATSGFNVIPVVFVGFDDTFYVTFQDDEHAYTYETNSENGYPSTDSK